MKVRLLNVLVALAVVVAFMGVAMAQDAAKAEAEAAKAFARSEALNLAGAHVEARNAAGA